MLNKTIGVFILRVLLGLLFLMSGYGKIFTWGMDQVYSSFRPYEETWLPKFLIDFAAYFTTYTEFIAGFLLVIGLFRNYALYALGAVLLIVSYGHGLTFPIWDLGHVFPRVVLLVALLLLPEEWDKWQIQKLVKK